MIKKNFEKGIQYIMAFIIYVFSISCQGPLAGEEIEFITNNVYKDLTSEANRIVMKTKKSNWTFKNVRYNDTIANLSNGKFYKIYHDGEILDTLFSYKTEQINDKWVTEIRGSFFFINCENPRDKNEPKIITVDITENISKEKRVLLVELINLDTENYFIIEQNPFQ